MIGVWNRDWPDSTWGWHGGGQPPSAVTGLQSRTLLREGEHLKLQSLVLLMMKMMMHRLPLADWVNGSASFAAASSQEGVFGSRESCRGPNGIKTHRKWLVWRLFWTIRKKWMVGSWVSQDGMDWMGGWVGWWRWPFGFEVWSLKFEHRFFFIYNFSDGRPYLNIEVIF